MMTVPVHGFMGPEIERRLAAAMEPTEHWSVPPEYAAVINAERTAARLSSVGSLPGLLRDEAYLHADNNALWNGFREKGEQQVELVLARQSAIDLRYALGQVSLRVILPDTALHIVLERVCARTTDMSDRRRVRHALNTTAEQAKRLQLAHRNGWDIRMVPEADLYDAIGNEVVSSIVGEGMPDHPPGVYMEMKDLPGLPHERWETAGDIVERHASAHELLAARAIPEAEMLERLAAYATPDR